MTLFKKNLDLLYTVDDHLVTWAFNMLNKPGNEKHTRARAHTQPHTHTGQIRAVLRTIIRKLKNRQRENCHT